MGRLIDGYAEGLIDRAEFEPRIASFRRRTQDWEAQIKAMRDEAAQQTTLSLILGHIADFARGVPARLEGLEWHERRDLIRRFVKRVEIGRVDINASVRIDPPPPCDPSGR